MTFDGRLISGVSVLAAVIDAGSFVKAADRLGLSPSGVSRAVSRLESRIGIRLLDRTTRSLGLTTEGAQFYADVLPHLEGIAEAAATATGSAKQVRGRLRVNVDSYFSGLILAPHLPVFCRKYPELEIELYTRDSIGDLISDGIDLALRFGPQPNSSMVARKLLETRILTVASPAYLKRNGRPETPDELVNHACLQFRNPLTGLPFMWEFHRGRKVVSIPTRGPLLLTDVNTMLASCLAGVGIAQVMALGVQPLLASRQLIELFPEWPDEVFPLYVVYPSRRNPAAKVRAFLDFCLEMSRTTAQ